MHKLKAIIVIIAILILSAFTVHVVLNAVQPLTSAVSADLWLYTPKPASVPLGEPQIVQINGFASYSVTEQVNIVLLFSSADGTQTKISFVVNQGAFLKLVTIPQDFNPGQFGTYPICAEMLSTNGTVVATSNVINLNYTNPGAP